MCGVWDIILSNYYYYYLVFQNRFQILTRAIDGKMETINKKIKACFVLHNFIQRRRGASDVEVEAADAVGAPADDERAPAVHGNEAPSAWRERLAAKAFADNTPH